MCLLPKLVPNYAIFFCRKHLLEIIQKWQNSKPTTKTWPIKNVLYAYSVYWYCIFPIIRPVIVFLCSATLFVLGSQFADYLFPLMQPQNTCSHWRSAAVGSRLCGLWTNVNHSNKSSFVPVLVFPDDDSNSMRLIFGGTGGETGWCKPPYFSPSPPVIVFSPEEFESLASFLFYLCSSFFVSLLPFLSPSLHFCFSSAPSLRKRWVVPWLSPSFLFLHSAACVQSHVCLSVSICGCWW